MAKNKEKSLMTVERSSPQFHKQVRKQFTPISVCNQRWNEKSIITLNGAFIKKLVQTTDIVDCSNIIGLS